MTDLFDFQAQSNCYGVMGDPIAHSKSPQIHQLFAQQFDLAIEYDRIQVPAGGFAQAVSHFIAHGGAGLNVTLPFKVEAWQLCTKSGNQISDRARRAEAVNTLRFDLEHAMHGDNTDGVGMIRDIENNLGVGIKGKRVLMLGAGGAARGVLAPLMQCEPSDLVIANRTAHKARDLAQKFGDEGGAGTNLMGCGYEKLAQLDDVAFDLIINATAASIDGELPDINARCVHADSVAYDMMYARVPTVFMDWARANGASRASDGLGMLVEQAAESFHVWHAQRPDTAAVISALRKL